jgi:hypothetical protein
LAQRKTAIVCKLTVRIHPHLIDWLAISHFLVFVDFFNHFLELSEKPRIKILQIVKLLFLGKMEEINMNRFSAFWTTAITLPDAIPISVNTIIKR